MQLQSDVFFRVFPCLSVAKNPHVIINYSILIFFNDSSQTIVHKWVYLSTNFLTIRNPLKKLKKRSLNQMINWQDYITVDPMVCHGQACIKDTRIMVSVVLDNLAAGVPVDEIIQSYSSLTKEAIQASVAYAAALARKQFISIAM